MLREDKIIALYCIVDDMLKASRHHEPSSRRLCDSEFFTTAQVSALYFGGHLDKARGFMKISGLVPTMLDKSPF